MAQLCDLTDDVLTQILAGAGARGIAAAGTCCWRLAALQAMLARLPVFASAMSTLPVLEAAVCEAADRALAGMLGTWHTLQAQQSCAIAILCILLRMPCMTLSIQSVEPNIDLCYPCHRPCRLCADRGVQLQCTPEVCSWQGPAPCCAAAAQPSAAGVHDTDTTAQLADNDTHSTATTPDWHVISTPGLHGYAASSAKCGSSYAAYSRALLPCIHFDAEYAPWSVHATGHPMHWLHRPRLHGCGRPWPSL